MIDSLATVVFRKKINVLLGAADFFKSLLIILLKTDGHLQSEVGFSSLKILT